jgi:hypothetical protein
MTRKCISTAICAGLYLTAFAVPTLLTVTEARAAQAYYCVCNGEKKRFLASTRYCEHQNNVKSCTQAQFNATYTKACKSMSCRRPTQRDNM